MKITKYAFVLGFGLLYLMLPGSLRANTIYSYSGAPYSSCNGGYAPCPPVTISLSITFDTSLQGTALDNLNNSNITPDVTSFSMSDGVFVSITNLTANNYAFFISTGASGGITGWAIFSTSNSGGISEFAGSCGFVALAADCGPEADITGGVDCSSFLAGSIQFPVEEADGCSLPSQPYDVYWQAPKSTATTPEPSSLLLLTIGLLGLMTMMWRREWPCVRVGLIRKRISPSPQNH
jgi:hypothetical protein